MIEVKAAKSSMSLADNDRLREIIQTIVNDAGFTLEEIEEVAREMQEDEP